ncbi:CpaD family pilus assembly protein [Microvirga tunisiensis]|uniref:Pilus assembly protein CpaD n=1 Tax=Microvirga tunisiensis TaxID=2108360 RepID=A0A5N7MB46_9HYPH|nr:CpaD family pilus assembly protein [Microvirga tunisiensis]MPR08145.1 hypothetical protein [Microvirga tunisiensis]MPR24142.1 hypothetical protein [Microvirga tunisiensis]
MTRIIRGTTVAALISLSALTLSACSTTDFVDTNVSPIPAAHDERFPIELRNAPQELRVYPMRAYGLDPRQTRDVRDFARSFRNETKSPLLISIPTNPVGGSEPAASRTAKEIKDELDRLGINGGNVRYANYMPEDPGKVSPVKLSYITAQAKVVAECGVWHDDLGVASLELDMNNREYENFGCATQTMIAQQIADPLDAVRPRQMDRIDTAKRLNAIGKLRNGEDPGTKWVRPEAGIQESMGSGGN